MCWVRTDRKWVRNVRAWLRIVWDPSVWFVYPHIVHKKNCCDLNLGESLWYLPTLFSQILDFIFRNGFYFYFDLFWMTPKNSNIAMCGTKGVFRTLLVWRQVYILTISVLALVILFTRNVFFRVNIGTFVAHTWQPGMGLIWLAVVFEACKVL